MIRNDRRCYLLRKLGEVDTRGVVDGHVALDLWSEREQYPGSRFCKIMKIACRWSGHVQSAVLRIESVILTNIQLYIH